MGLYTQAKNKVPFQLFPVSLKWNKDPIRRNTEFVPPDSFGQNTKQLCEIMGLYTHNKRICFHPLHRYEFGPRKFFSKKFKFGILFYSISQIFGGANVEKHADPEKKNRNRRKSRANSRNLLEPFLRSRKEKNL